MSIPPTLRHLGNDAADRLVLYLQDDTPLELLREHVTCNPRCHTFDAGVVAGRMPEILEDERRVTREAFVAFASELIEELEAEHSCTEVDEYRRVLRVLIGAEQPRDG